MYISFFIVIARVLCTCISMQSSDTIHHPLVVFMRPTVPQAPTSDPTDSKPRTFTEEELKEALLDIFGKNLSLLKEPMEAMNTPTAVDQASDRSGLSDGPNGLDETDQAGPVVDQNELNPFAPIPGDVEKNQYDGNYYDEDGEGEAVVEIHFIYTINNIHACTYVYQVRVRHQS